MKLLGMAAVFGLLLFVPLAGCDEEDAAVRAVAEGNRLLEARDYAGALAKYEEALELRPESHEIHHDLGLAKLRGYDLEPAVEELAAAAETEDPVLASRAHYNLGVAKYRQAHGAMQTFQDALSFTQAAIGHWRESLELNPDQPDAVYNLELAYRLVGEINAQNVQAQRNAETRDQKTSDNRGQSFENEEDRATNTLSDQSAPKTSSENMEAGQGVAGDQAAAPVQQMSQMQEAGKQDDLSPAAAKEMLELMRQRATAAQNQRQAEQQVRILAGRPDRYW